MYMPVVGSMLAIRYPMTTASVQITYQHHHGTAPLALAPAPPTENYHTNSYKATQKNMQEQNKVIKTRNPARHPAFLGFNAHPTSNAKTENKPSNKKCQSLTKILIDIQLTNQNDYIIIHVKRFADSMQLELQRTCLFLCSRGNNLTRKRN